MAKQKKQPDLKPEDEYRLDSVKLIDADTKEPYIKLRSLSIEKKAEIAKIIMTQVTQAKENKERAEFVKHMKYCRQRYTMEDMNNSFPWEGASERRTGMTTIHVDRALPRIKKAFFYSGRIMDVVPGEGNTEENAQLQGQWLDSVLRHEVELEEVADNWLYDAVMLNFGVLKLRWSAEEEKKGEITVYESAEELLRNYPSAIAEYPKYIVRLTGVPIPELIQAFPVLAQDPSSAVGLPNAGIKLPLSESYRTRKSGGRAEWVNPEHMIYPKGITDVSKAWIIVQILEMRRDELLRKSKDKFFENVDKLLVEADKPDSKTQEKRDYGKVYKIYEAKLLHDIDGDDLEEKSVFWVAADSKGKELFLRGIKYPYSHNEDYWNLTRSGDHRYGFYTGGLGYKLKSINKGQDRQYNSILNGFDQAVASAWGHVETPGTPFRPRIHKIRPAGVVPLKDPKELFELRSRDIPNSSFNLLEYGDRVAELLTGIPQALMSGQVTPTDPNAPAKKAELLLAEGNISISDYVKSIAKTFRRIAFQTQMTYYQLTNTTDVDFRMDKGTNTISKSQMRGELMFHNSSTVESVLAEEKARSYLGLLQQIKDDPLMSQNYSFQGYLWETIIKNWSEELARNIDKAFPPEVQRLIENQLRQAQEEEQRRAQEEQRNEQLNQYRERRKAEGASPETIQVEIEQMSQQGQGQGEVA